MSSIPRSPRCFISSAVVAFAAASSFGRAAEPAAPAAYQWPPGYFNARSATDPSKPQPSCKPGELRLARTHYSLSIEWDLEGDTDHDATCHVSYKRQDESQWHEALPLLRVDYIGWYDQKTAERPFNMLAGSVMFLRPGASYDLRLRLADPDNAAPLEELRHVRTKPLPAFDKPARTLHVLPPDAAAQPGDGTQAKPFRGVPQALAQAKPGDLYLLHAGNYGSVKIEVGGEAGSNDSATDQTRYLGLKAAGDGPAVLEQLRLSASHLWLEGLTFQKTQEATALKDEAASENVVLRGCAFRDYHYAILLSVKSRGWYIADNDIVGDTTKGISGEGVELNHSSDHTVCYNRITRSADGISYPLTNCDLFGNDIFEVSDDPIEPDYGYANIRIWGNRLHGHTGISFQPMYCGPWYIVRNQIVANFIFKLRVQDRFIMVNNTFAGRDTPVAHAHGLLTAFSRNNVWIHLGGHEHLWLSQAPDSEKNRSYYVKYALFDSPVANWKTDLDYDGFEFSAAKPHPKLKTLNPFFWLGERYFDLPAFAKAVGIEAHGRTLDRAKTFEAFDLNDSIPGRDLPLLKLCAASEAQDAGVAVPNLAEEFDGASPDLGAFELGRPLPG